MPAPKPPDDPSIGNDDLLWRRVPPEQVVFDENLNRLRPSSMAFQNTSGTSGMSVNIAAETTVENTLRESENLLLVEFPASVPRGVGQGVIRNPLPDNPAHAEVTGKKTKSVQKTLYNNCAWVVGPP